MRTPAPLLALACAAALAAAQPALACSCNPYASAAEQAGSADLIFRGRAFRTHATLQALQGDGLLDTIVGGVFARETTFEVLETLKGDAGEQVGVRHYTDSMCGGVQFEGGATYLIFARRDADGRYGSDACMRAQFTEDDYRAVLGAGGLGGE